MNPEEKERVLNRRRGNLRQQLTRIESYIDQQGEAATIEDISVRLDNVGPMLEKFNAIQDEIDDIKLANSGEIDEHDENVQGRERGEFEDRYYRAVSACKQLIKQKQDNELSQAEATPLQNSASMKRADTPNKLPTIQLPKFDGQVNDWHSFKDTFVSLIHNDVYLDNIRKFHYLKACLTGEASHLITSISVTAGNYEIAWKAVTERFDNKKIMLNHQLNVLFGQRAIKDQNFKEVRNLLDTTKKCINALSAMELPIEHWDPILIHTVVSRLDDKTKQAWNITLVNDVLPTFKELEDFLEKLCYALSNSNPSDGSKCKNTNNQKFSLFASSTQSRNMKCSVCSEDHKTYLCNDLVKLSPRERFSLIKQKNLCLKCFKNNHVTSKCRFFDCGICQKKHNKMLHFSEGEDPRNETSVLVSTGCEVLLATTLVRVKDNHDSRHMCRGLLDSGSQSNFITRKTAEKLGLQLKKAHAKIDGINTMKTQIHHYVDLEISSPIHDFSKVISCFVLNSITGTLPKSPINTDKWRIIKNITLADPTFCIPGSIDILLGADTFEDVCLNETMKEKHSGPVFRSTVFGWVVTGKIETSSGHVGKTFTSCTSITELSNQIRQFWELEEVDTTKNEDNSCEKHFQHTYKRLESGRFQVQMPMKEGYSEHDLGDSFNVAKRRFIQLERRLESKPQMKERYNEFMKEYLEMDHMERAKNDETGDSKKFYLPQLVVINQKSETTKLRVVFNGSQKSTSGLSLNDILICGPNIQDDLFSILLRFRFHLYAFSADVAKMYRQVSVDDSQRDLLRVLWRPNAEEPIKQFKLTTVTYGTTPASFLSTRCLKQLAIDFDQEYPDAARILTKDCYVDNVLSGANNLQLAKKLRDDLIKITGDGCFPLRQWCSNDPKVINDLHKDLKHKLVEIRSSQPNIISTLGMSWEPSQDQFLFQFNFSTEKPTKRSLISESARIFDPLGILAPITVKAKIMIQMTWIKKVDWDEELDEEIANLWSKFTMELEKARQISVPRFIGQFQSTKQYNIHAFCDASKNAYAACIYVVRERENSKKLESRLVCAKTKVSPLKEVSVARLELCGALLAAKLLSKFVNLAINMKFENVNLWCDSQISLYWISSTPGKWQPFVKTRVSQIQEELKNIPHTWHYVPTKLNPADLASRGCKISTLINDDMWWMGPMFITGPKENWPQMHMAKENESHDSSMGGYKCLVTATSAENEHYFINDFSSFSKLQRTVMWILRFRYSVKNNPEHRCFTAVEYERAEKRLVMMHQKKNFADDLWMLEKHQKLLNNSKILSLTPYVDKEGILRVGGRLHNSDLDIDHKHPIILQKGDKLTELLIEYMHRKHYHAGVQLLKTMMQKKFWIIRGTSSIKKVIRQCMTCAKFRKSTMVQQMGNLPETRVTIANPFERCGLDYAGPFILKKFKGKCNKMEKSYACIFVCFITRAVHIELVSDLSSEAFIAALRRFVARRGCPKDIYSDNGKNFVGARTKFDELKKLIQSREFQNKTVEFAANEFIDWHTIPTYSPHMGGLWEAGVKSMKTHLRAVLGERKLTFEEMYTVLSEIEMCLNSRPLTELSSDPSDLEALTPAHFLISKIPQSIPQKDYTKIAESYCNRWELMKKLKDRIWQRWQTEYLSRLQTRTKWKIRQPNIKIGDLVMIKKSEVSPLKWPLGRVNKLHQGNDELVRVVELRTCKGLSTHSLAHICKLPLAIENASQPGEHVQG